MTRALEKALLALFIAVALGLSACGGGGTADSAGEASATGPTAQIQSVSKAAATTQPATYTLQYTGETLYGPDYTCTYDEYFRKVCPAFGNVTATIVFKSADAFDSDAAITVISAIFRVGDKTLNWPNTSTLDRFGIKCFVPTPQTPTPYCYGGLVSSGRDLHITMNIWASGYVYGDPNDSVDFAPPAGSGQQRFYGSTIGTGKFTYTVAYGDGDSDPIGKVKNLGNCDCGGSEGNLPSGSSTVADDPIAKGGGSGNLMGIAVVNSGTGNLYVAHTDFAAADHARLSFTRHYNSQDVRVTSLGYGWRTEWHKSIGGSLASGIATVSRADGRTDTFTRAANGTWNSEPDVQTALSVITDASGAQTGWKVVRTDDSTETYSVTGALLSLRARPGQMTTLAYNASGNLASVTGPFGHKLAFTYSGALMATMTAPDGGTYQFSYDSNNNLVSIKYPDNSVRRYLYEFTGAPVAGIDRRHALTGIVDERGIRYATYSYDQYANTVGIRRGSLRSSTLSYEPSGRAVVTTPNGFAHTTELTTQHRLVKPVKVTGTPYPSAGGALFSYDTNGGLASVTDWNGNVTTYAYDARNNLVSRTDAAGTSLARTIATAWHPTLRLPTQITGPTESIQFSYDASGNVLSRTLRSGQSARTWQYSYSIAGQVTSETDPRGATTNFAYDALGNLIRITDALGNVTSIPEHDANGRVTKLVDPNGLVTTIAYDKRGRTTSETSGGLVIAYTYDAAGNVSKVTRPDGSTFSMGYDSAHRLTSVTDSLGNKILYILDADGNRAQTIVSAPGGATSRQSSASYDFAGRVIQITGSASQITTFARDSNGNVVSVTDPLGAVTQATYDALNRRVTSTDVKGGRTSFSYDAVDRLLSVTDPRNLTTTYSYNGIGDLLQTVSPDSGTTTRTVDANGNLLTSTDARGLTNSRAYDALNRLTGITYPGGRQTYQYDTGANGIGRLAAVSGNTDSTAFAYDQLGRLTTKRQTVGTSTLAQVYAYNAAGQLASMTYPSGMLVGYGYDTAGQVASLTVNGTTFASSIAHEPFGPARSWNWPGQTYLRPHDKDGRVSSYLLGTTTRTLTYDAGSRITRYTDTAGARQDFGYDELGRLTSYANAAISQSYGYDADGNRTSLTANGVTATYGVSSGSNQLLGRSNPATSYVYDAAGNLIATGAMSFSYDALGRMTGALVGAARSAGRTLYYVNGLGQRVQKAGPAGTTTFLYGDGSQLLGEYGAASSQETIYLDGLPVAVNNNGALLRIYTDHLGAPRVITNQAGAVRWTWDGEPFGNVAPTGTITFNQRFPGQYADSETGLYFNHARYYDPKIGRYTQSDPIGLRGGINTYTYVRSRPSMYTDAEGLVDQNWFGNESESQWSRWGRNYDPIGWYTVLGHGDPQHFCGGALCGSPGADDISAKSMAQRIYMDPNYWPGMPVQLIACNTGVGDNSYAQQLANALGDLARLAGHDDFSRVEGANGFVRTPSLQDPSGFIFIPLPPIVDWGFGRFNEYYYQH